MRKIIAQIICCFVPSPEMRRKIRYAFRTRDAFRKNYICLYDDFGNETRLTSNKIPQLKIMIGPHSYGNTVRIHKGARFKKSVIDISGKNSFVQIGRIYCWTAPGLDIFANSDDVRIVISDGVTFNGRIHISANYKSDVFIGADCMFSKNVEIWATDYHTILDSKNKVINIPHGVHIGSHCWICANACIMKSAHVSDNSVVGNMAMVGGRFSESNVIIAGNPARVVKKKIHWVRDLVGDYVSK